MKRYLLILISLISLSLFAKDYITIYNNDFALVKTQLELNLEKGLQNYIFEDIPELIESKSLIFNTGDSNLKILSKNFECDLNSNQKILNKSLNKSITLFMRNNKEYTGLVKYINNNMLGLSDSKTNEFIMLDINEITNLKLNSIPDNIFLKPSIKFELDAPTKAKYLANISYLTHGLSYIIHYNAVYKNGKLEITPWVNLTNQSGKSFKDVNIKLLVGEVNRSTANQYPNIKFKRNDSIETINDTTELSASFSNNRYEEESFSDYHIYTLKNTINLDNLQTKEIPFFSTKVVNCSKTYYYKVYASTVNCQIDFFNKLEDGLGMPLPKGEIKVYEYDLQDNTLEFTGEDNLEHTPVNTLISLKTGQAFDVTAKTNILKEKRSESKLDKDLEVILENKSDKDINITIEHTFWSNAWQISDNNFDYESKNVNTILIKRNIKAHTADTLKWSQREKL